MSGQDADARHGHVYLVGAGPGRADLLTMRAHHLLKTATHVLPDGLVSPAVLAVADRATVIPVSKRCGKPGPSQAEINARMVALARDGAAVVRLKSGDPLVFGRAGEEIAALREAGIPFEIVPGISAAFAAAARLEQPLTDRTSASKLILATAHYAANKHELDGDPQPLWSGPLPKDATLVVYMPGPDLEQLAARLIAAGISEDTPVATVSRVSAAEERVHTTELRQLRSIDCGPAPVLLLIGRTLGGRHAS